MSVIGNLFGRSPIRPMQQHMKVAADCAGGINALLAAMAAGDQAALDEARSQIDEFEHKADELKHEIRSNLPQRLFLQDVAELAAMRQMHTPPALGEPLANLAAAALETCAQSSSVVNELDELVETGFGRHEVSRVEEMIDQLNVLESRADECGEAALRTLFAIEDEIGVSAYYWYEIIRWIGDIADYAERAGNRIRLLVAT